MSKVLLFEPTIDRCGVEALAVRAEIVMAPEGSEETIVRYLSSSDVAGVIVRGEKITRRAIEKSVGLRVIGTPGVGVDVIDVKAASDRGILL
jgi:D-3-phosphoglycerate dehydrogenase